MSDLSVGPAGFGSESRERKGGREGWWHVQPGGELFSWTVVERNKRSNWDWRGAGRARGCGKRRRARARPGRRGQGQVAGTGVAAAGGRLGGSTRVAGLDICVGFDTLTQMTEYMYFINAQIELGRSTTLDPYWRRHWFHG